MNKILNITYIPNWLSRADAMFMQLNNMVQWQQEKIKMFGKAIVVPRRVAWYGDAGAFYKYGGVVHEPLPWLGPLKNIKDQLKYKQGLEFNSVLANLYRNGQDYMGWGVVE